MALKLLGARWWRQTYADGAGRRVAERRDRRRARGFPGLPGGRVGGVLDGIAEVGSWSTESLFAKTGQASAVLLDRRTLARARLLAQGLLIRPFATPADAVTSFGAMQGQDLPGVLASAALRTAAGGVRDVLADLDAGHLVRGYPMRGTVFLQAAADVTWTTELCAAPALRASAARRGQLGLSDALIDQARQIAAAAVAQCQTGVARPELLARWEAAGIPVAGGAGYHVLTHLIATSDLVYGPWNGTDQNLVGRGWLPADGTLEARFHGDRIAATAEFLGRYLTSHGPATLRDFAWWTKLPLRDIRAAWTLIADGFERSADPEPQVWRPGLLDELAAVGRGADRPLLLPGFDEFILGYADRLFAMTAEQHARLVPGNNGVFGKSVVVGAQVRGLWRRAGRPGRRSLEVDACAPLGVRLDAQLRGLFDRFPFATP